MSGRPTGGRPHVGPLTPTSVQLEILDRLSHGQDMPQIAREMGISVNTARRYVRTAMERLDAATTAHAVAEAIRRHLITDGVPDVP